jgi:hypothetical protein
VRALRRRCGPDQGAGPARYTCNGYHRHGVSVCGNGLRILAPAFERATLDAVAARLEPAVVAEAVSGAIALLNASQATSAPGAPASRPSWRPSRAASGGYSTRWPMVTGPRRPSGGGCATSWPDATRWRPSS